MRSDLFEHYVGASPVGKRSWPDLSVSNAIVISGRCSFRVVEGHDHEIHPPDIEIEFAESVPNILEFESGTFRKIARLGNILERIKDLVQYFDTFEITFSDRDEDLFFHQWRSPFRFVEDWIDSTLLSCRSDTRG